MKMKLLFYGIYVDSHVSIFRVLMNIGRQPECAVVTLLKITNLKRFVSVSLHIVIKKGSDHSGRFAFHIINPALAYRGRYVIKTQPHPLPVRREREFLTAAFDISVEIKGHIRRNISLASSCHTSMRLSPQN
jgi:hypothetical protein